MFRVEFKPNLTFYNCGLIFIYCRCLNRCPKTDALDPKVRKWITILSLIIQMREDVETRVGRTNGRCCCSDLLKNLKGVFSLEGEEERRMCVRMCVCVCCVRVCVLCVCVCVCVWARGSHAQRVIITCVVVKIGHYKLFPARKTKYGNFWNWLETQIIKVTYKKNRNYLNFGWNWLTINLSPICR